MNGNEAAEGLGEGSKNRTEATGGLCGESKNGNETPSSTGPM